jgi:hypothetical protein
VIPEDEYGGGAVIVWDCGIYDHLTEKGGKLEMVWPTPSTPDT